MAPKMDSAKKFLIFLGKSLFALLETLIFTLIPKPRKNVAGEIVLITGAGSGLGRLLALKFARLGAVIVLWDVSEEGNEETCRMARDEGATRAYAYTCDCSRKEEVYRVADQVKKEVGDVSILINNAGIVTGRKFLNCPDELMEKSFDVNFKAHLWFSGERWRDSELMATMLLQELLQVIYVVLSHMPLYFITMKSEYMTYKAFLPAMIANDHGHLVCISSSAGLIGVNGLADYCASKFAAFGFAESIFMELFAQKITGIKTTIVCPFFIKTGMFEGCTTGCPSLLPILEPEYAVRKIVDAILQEKMYLCIPRFIYFMMFLKSILPIKMGLLLAEYMGIFSVMNGFIGKKKN